MKKIILFIFFLSMICQMISCKKTPNSNYYNSVSCNDPDDSLNTYTLKIGTIFNTSCVRSSCHDSNSHKGKINLEGYDNAVSSFNNKPVLCAIYHNKHCKPMPKGGSKLSDDAIHDITCWAKNGFP